MVRSYIFVYLAGVGFQLAQASTTIASDCINLRLQNNWLIGDCKTGSGSTRIQSSVYLNSKITNREGVLGWQDNGRYAASCIECTIASPATLSCKCRPTWGQHVPTSLDLQGHIANYNGHLLSDLNGTPTPPTTASTLQFPSDPSWSAYFGNTSCYTTEPSSGICPNQGVGSGLTCSTSASISTTDGALSCFPFRWPVSVPAWATWASARLAAPSSAYIFQFYDNLECTGGPAGIISPADLGTCKAFQHQMIAITAVPLWNAQV